VVAGGVERLGLHPLGGLLYEAAQVVNEPPGADGVTLSVLGDGLRHLDANIRALNTSNDCTKSYGRQEMRRLCEYVLQYLQ
jgi:hypothetical protein